MQKDRELLDIREELKAVLRSVGLVALIMLPIVISSLAIAIAGFQRFLPIHQPTKSVSCSQVPVVARVSNYRGR